MTKNELPEFDDLPAPLREALARLNALVREDEWLNERKPARRRASRKKRNRDTTPELF